LTESDFGEIAQAGASFIWSPRSNFELYGETADMAAALRKHVTMALAPDWSPTGSTNMLAEIAYAKAVIDRDFKGLVSAQQLFEMATIVPARIARIDDKVGQIKPGLYGDLFLLRGDTGKPFDALTGAAPQDVTLVLVNGVPVYGAKAYLDAAGVPGAEAVTLCGQTKAINQKAMPGKLADITARLTVALAGEKLTLAGLAECR
jgi:5-methylthioadenosine/S-adenosylhomocysteine deaminase